MAVSPHFAGTPADIVRHMSPRSSSPGAERRRVSEQRDVPEQRRSPERLRGPSPRYLREVQRPEVRDDLRTLAFFVRIYCDGQHRARHRSQHSSAAVADGVYDTHPPVLCDECSRHLRYGEARRVFCRLDPKPFCARCEVHCFKQSERDWNRGMMRYSGPRSLFHGYAREGARHFVGSVRARLPRILGGTGERWNKRWSLR